MTLVSIHCYAQNLETNRDKIETAKTEMAAAIANFSTCLVDSDLENCIEDLVKNADNVYKKFIIPLAQTSLSTMYSTSLSKAADAKGEACAAGSFLSWSGDRDCRVSTIKNT